MQRTLKNEKYYRKLFLVAALYDFILGCVFFIALPFLFENIFKIPAPNYPAFFQAAAAFIIIMGIGFYFVYLNLYRNIDIVRLGIILKLVYTALAFYYVFIENMPWIFSIFGFLDLIFIVFFVFFLRAVKRETQA
ncbi:MAG: hypothetical protein Q8O55_13530 [Dehalococcoidales bacterium]|nr:hypothetical protein [Dehalococcoidales bacterium]